MGMYSNAINKTIGAIAGATIGLKKAYDKGLLSKANQTSADEVMAKKTQKTTMRVPKNMQKQLTELSRKGNN